MSILLELREDRSLDRVKNSPLQVGLFIYIFVLNSKKFPRN